MWMLTVLLWLVAPPVELAVIVGLGAANGRYKRKIRELEGNLKECGELVGREEQEEEKAAAVLGQGTLCMARQREEGRQEAADPVKEIPAEGKLACHNRGLIPAGGNMGILALLAGVVFVVLAGLIFATTAWQVLSNPAKVLFVLAFSGVFFCTSFLAERKLHIHKTGNALYVLGSIFLFLAVLAAAYFRLLGPEYVLDGQNRWRVLWVGSLVAVVMLFFGIERFHDRIYTQACCWGMTVNLTFLLLACEVSVFSKWASAMMGYAFLLVLGKWRLEKAKGRREKRAGGKLAAMLAEEIPLFAQIHFWVFAFLVVGLGTVGGLFQVTWWFGWWVALALAAAVGGSAVLLRQTKPGWQKTFFVLAMAGTVHYLAAWLCFAHAGGNGSKGMWAFLLAEAVTAVYLAAKKRRGSFFWTKEGDCICLGFLLWDAGMLNGRLFLEQIWGRAYIRDAVLCGHAGKALAGGLLLAAVVMAWKKRSAVAHGVLPFLMWYLVSWPLTVWAECKILGGQPGQWQWLAKDWLDRGLFGFLLLGALAVWERKRKEGYGFSVLVLGTLMQVFGFSKEKLMFPYLLLLSGYLLSEEAVDGKRAAIQSELAAFYAMLGVYILMGPFTANSMALRLTGSVWMYAACMAMQKKWLGGFYVPGTRRVFWDVCGSFLAVFMMLAFYADPDARAWELLLCLAVSGGFYVMFYVGQRVWPHLLISVAWLPLPSVLEAWHGWTENELCLAIPAVLLVTGICARRFYRICEPDKRVLGGWRVDWFHVLAVFMLAVEAGRCSIYWRFCYLLFLGLYFWQYTAVEEWKRAARSASLFMLVLAFWSQPFVAFPSSLWMEIKLLPAAGYLWLLGRIWNEWEGKRDTASVQGEGNFVCAWQDWGYLLCLLALLANAWVRAAVVNALILEGVCLSVFVWALARHCRKWIWAAGGIMVLVALYMTKGFWLSISWWVYLLTAGIGLIVFAALYEKKKH